MALRNNRSYGNRNYQQSMRQFGGLSYATVHPEFVGRPVDDIKESRKILQERSDVNRAGYMDLENTYGTLVDKVHRSELPYLDGFKKDFESKVADRIANDEFEYMGSDIARSAAKLSSDVGLQKRFERKKTYDESVKAIDDSGYSYEEKVKAKSWQENQYKPVTPEEDANLTYDAEVDYRTLPKQADVAAKVIPYFKALTPNIIGKAGTKFVKAGADLSTGRTPDKFTDSYVDSDKTGVVYDTKTMIRYEGKDNIAQYFKGFVNENISPEIDNFFKTKYELANRREDQTSDEFWNSEEAGGYEQFVENSMVDLAESLAYRQDTRETTIRHFAGLMPKAKDASDGYKSSVTTYDYGEAVETTAGSNTEEAVTIAETNEANTNQHILDQQRNVGVSEDEAKSYEVVESELRTGKGLNEILPNLKDQPVRQQQVASSIQDQHTNESIQNARFTSAFNYAKDKLKANGIVIDDAKYSTFIENFKKSKGIIADIEDKGESLNFIEKLGAKIGYWLDNDDDKKVLVEGINEWFDDSSNTVIDSQITTRFPKFEGEDQKVLTKQITDVVKSASFFDINKDVIRVQGPDYESSGEFVEGRLAGNVASVDLLGYRPVPIDGQRHWKLHVVMKPEKSGEAGKEADILVPMNVLKTEATDMLMSLPQVKASDMLHQPMINGLKEWSPYSDTKIIYTPGIGTSLNIGGTLYTNPDQMNTELAKRIEQDRQTIINGKSQ